MSKNRTGKGGTGSGKGRGGGSRDNDDDFDLHIDLHDDDHVMEFTPPPGFDIRTMAGEFAEIMAETMQPLLIRLPNLTVEFEPGCTPKEIIDGYKLGLKRAALPKPSNKNDKR